MDYFCNVFVFKKFIACYIDKDVFEDLYGMIRRQIKRMVSRIGARHPEFVVKTRYRLRFRKKLDLDNPKTLNEKIQYLSLRTDTSEWTRLTDKYSVREYVKECGLEHTLNRLYGVWDKASDIDFEKLPKRFILKTTHDSGNCIVVNDINAVDRKKIIRKLESGLAEVYGLAEGNLHYSGIVPRIIAEDYLTNDARSAKYSTSLIDYKIWCFNGKAHYIWTCTDRTEKSTRVMTYDTYWNAHPEYSVFNSCYMRDEPIPEPVNLELMLETAEKLAASFPVVRVDLYNIDGRIVFGEMTFTSLGGFMDFYTDEFLLMTGRMIHLPG